MADPTQQSPFEIVTPGKSKKSGQKGLIVAILIVVFLILSVVAGVLLVRQQQDIRERAAPSNMCPAAEACPVAGQPNLLRSCHPAESDNTPGESICNVSFTGRIETCGQGAVQYCCNGSAWTTNMTACPTSATPTPSPTSAPTVAPTATPMATATATSMVTTTPTVAPTGTPSTTASAMATPTKTPTPTAAATVAPTSQGTPQPIPETGTDWPTLVGAGLGIIVIIASILIAL